MKPVLVFCPLSPPEVTNLFQTFLLFTTIENYAHSILIHKMFAFWSTSNLQQIGTSTYKCASMVPCRGSLLIPGWGSTLGRENCYTQGYNWYKRPTLLMFFLFVSEHLGSVGMDPVVLCICKIYLWGFIGPVLISLCSLSSIIHQSFPDTSSFTTIENYRHSTLIHKTFAFWLTLNV